MVPLTPAPHALDLTPSRSLPWVVGATLSLCGAAVAAPLIACFDAGLAGSTAHAAPLSTALLTASLVAAAMRSRSPSVAASVTVFGGAIAGALNAGLTSALASFGADHDLRRALLTLAFGSILGLVFCLPVGFVFGLAYALPVALAVRARELPNPDGVEPVIPTLGALVSLVGILAGWGHGPRYALLGAVMVALGVVALAGSVAADVRWWVALPRVADAPSEGSARVLVVRARMVACAVMVAVALVGAVANRARPDDRAIVPTTGFML